MDHNMILILIAGISVASAYSTHHETSVFTDALLREIVDQMGKDLEATNNYMDFPDPRLQSRLSLGRGLPDREIKQFPDDEYAPEYDSIIPDNQNPMIRDQEYLQHSSLWGHQYMAGGAGEGKQHLKPEGNIKNNKEVKTDAVLPAYCNPPNPCPFGYSAQDGCLEEFENTAAFSREYQAAQDCMCDTDHMFDCPDINHESDITDLARSIQNEGLVDTAIDKLVEQMSGGDPHKSLVAKKFHSKKHHDYYLSRLQAKAQKAAAQTKRLDSNPYLQGQKLPVHAKKGTNL